MPAGDPETLWSYDPFNNPALYQTFAYLDGSEAAILWFANKYGPLTVVGNTEPLSLWQAQIECLRKAIELDQLLKSGARNFPDWLENLDDLWTRQTNNRNRARARAGRPQVDYPALRTGSALSRRREDAREWLRWQVNEQIDAATPPLTFDPQNAGGTPLGLRIEAPTLQAALWFQFADAASGNRVFRQCAVCPEFFSVQPPLNRKTRRTCSPACKQRLYRRAKR